MRFLRGYRRSVVIALVLTFSVVAFAQDEEFPKADVFVGYQWLSPGVNAPLFPSNPPVISRLPAMAKGLGATGTYNFSKMFGLSLDFGGNWHDVGHEITLSAGPRVMWRSEDINLFAHAMLSYNELQAGSLSGRNSIGGIFGGGMDVPLWRHIYWRAFEADYVTAQLHYTDVIPPQFPSSMSRPAAHGARLRTGLVFAYGGEKTQPMTAACSVQPAEVMVGEPITATATVSNANPKHTLTYSWSSTGGKITGKDNTASIDTNGVSGGDYTATANITDPKQKKDNTASCSAKFTVKEPPKNPPTVSLSANPASVQAGGTVSLSASCTSPDNVPVNVANWTASSGTISGSGNSATLNTTGAQPGPITVNASCSDSRGLNTPASTTVTIVAPPPPPPPSAEFQRLEARLALHSVYFPTAQPTPQKPNGGLIASQQQTLTGLASDFQEYLKTKPDAHLILEGHADPRGSDEYNQALSERRVNVTKSFLVAHGVPEDHIEVKAFGKQRTLTNDEVKQSVEQNPELTPGERARILKNMRTIVLASDRRVDITLSTTGQTSVRQFPFNAADSLTLIGGREADMKKAPAKKRTTKKK